MIYCCGGFHVAYSLNRSRGLWSTWKVPKCVKEWLRSCSVLESNKYIDNLLKRNSSIGSWNVYQIDILNQCDQIVGLFFSIWPFATMKISPIMSQIRQSQLSILPNKKWTIKNLPKTGKLLPKWQNFAKSGHTTQRTLTIVGARITEQPLSSLTGLDSVVSVPTNINIFSCLVKGNPVKLETSHTVILPSIVTVLWLASTSTLRSTIPSQCSFRLWRPPQRHRELRLPLSGD